MDEQLRAAIIQIDFDYHLEASNMSVLFYHKPNFKTKSTPIIKKESRKLFLLPIVVDFPLQLNTLFKV
jgi:hypothetical protein